MSGPLIGYFVSTRAATAPAVTRGNDLSFRPGQPAYRGQSWAPASGAVRPRPGSVPVVLPGRRQVLAAHRADAAWAPVPGGRGASRWLLPGGQRGLSAAAPGARRPHQGHRRLAACPQTWPAVPPASAAARDAGQMPRCRAWRRPASAAGALTVSRPMPATGAGRDAIHGPAPDDRPAPPSRAAGSGHDTGAAVTCALTAMARIWRGCPRHPRSCRHGPAGLALAGCQCLLRAAVSPHRRP